MKILKIALLALLAATVLFVLGGFLIDGEVKLETEATLSAPPEAVFEVLNTYEGQVEWWTLAMKPHIEAGMSPVDIEHSGGGASGKGMQLQFVAGGDVAEDWEVLESDAPNRIVYDVDFQIFAVERTLTLTPEGAGTHVTWSDTAQIDNPVMRYLTLMPSDSVIENFNGALRALDQVTASAE
jgi:uncharacterized protein YndB with AHSA1/START domain